MLYIEEPDSHGHIYGPNSEVVLNVIQELDNVTQYLFVSTSPAINFTDPYVYCSCLFSRNQKTIVIINVFVTRNNWKRTDYPIKQMSSI